MSTGVVAEVERRMEDGEGMGLSCVIMWGGGGEADDEEVVGGWRSLRFRYRV